MSVRAGNITVTEMLLQKIDVNERDRIKSTALHYAAESGYLQMVELLLDNGAYVNSKNARNSTPLSVAGEKRHKDIIRLLLEHQASVRDVNLITQGHEESILNVAVIDEDMDIIKILLDHQADLSEEIDVIEAVIKGKDINLINELNLAIRDKNLPIIEILFEWNVDINFPDTSGITPLNLAIQLNDKDIDKIFLKAIETPLYFDNVVTSENLDMIKLLLRSGADFTEFHDYGLQILLSAIEYEKEDIVRESLNDQAVIDLINNANTKPLILAIYKEKIEIINILVSKIDVNIVNKSGITALMAAAEIGNIIIAQTLLENNADINYVNEYGITALYIAALTGNEKLVEMLLHSGARENVEISGNAILFRAVEARNITAIKLLMMEPSTSNTNLDIIRNVMSNRANINCVNDNGRTPLHVAISLKYLDVIRTLLAYGPDAHQADKHGFTPLDMIVQICKEVIEKMRCSSIVSRDDIRLGLIIKELHSKTNSFEEKRIIAETLDLIFDR
ncbi:Ankyrin repeats (3 copies) [Popillia japonica]|uniref:Ankyrin repeats (3 copies) n=1 Tax=Popillia japonica TaxID=7064 RepID=A0AAW1N7H0_POPJA